MNAFDDKKYEENYLIPEIKGTSWFDSPLDIESNIYNVELLKIPIPFFQNHEYKQVAWQEAGT